MWEQSEPTDLKCVEIAVMGTLKLSVQSKMGLEGACVIVVLGAVVAPEMASQRWPLVIPTSAPGQPCGFKAGHGVSHHNLPVWLKGYQKKERGI